MKEDLSKAVAIYHPPLLRVRHSSSSNQNNINSFSNSQQENIPPTQPPHPQQQQFRQRHQSTPSSFFLNFYTHQPLSFHFRTTSSGRGKQETFNLFLIYI